MSEIVKLLNEGESEEVEFKPSLSQMDKILECISAFSNTRGGIIVVGVSDKGKVLGVDIGKRTIENLANMIKQNIRLFGFRTEYSFQRIDKLEYPIKAIRECIINALIHRNYFEPADTRVAIYDDRIEIISPGTFPEGVTPEEPKHVPVNPILCQLMYDVGFIEKYGSGIYMINELCEGWGIPKPEYRLSEVETTVIFKSSGKAIVTSEIEKLGVELNERQREGLKIIFEKGKITNADYAKVFKISRNTATNDLTELIKKGLIKRVGRGRGSYYVPKI